MGRALQQRAAWHVTFGWPPHRPARARGLRIARLALRLLALLLRQKSVNYKYFQGNRTRFVCCSRGRIKPKRMEGEYAFYRMLEGRGLLRLRSAANHAAKRHSQ